MATLLFSDADSVERWFQVGAEPVVIGRSPECAIRSDDPRVSRVHARIFKDHFGTVFVEDLGSANGVFVGPNKVQISMMPVGELVVVGSLLFRLAPPDGSQLPPIQGLHGLLGRWLEMERKMRVATAEERDAYGARMAELHQELARAKHVSEKASGSEARLAELRQRTDELLAERQRIKGELGAAKERIVQLETQLGTRVSARVDTSLAAMTEELESYKERLADTEERAKAAETRLASTEEELSVARADAMAAEERMVSEMSALEQRLSAELAGRVEELEITRSDLTNAEERNMALQRMLDDYRQQLAQK